MRLIHWIFLAGLASANHAQLHSALFFSDFNIQLYGTEAARDVDSDYIASADPDVLSAPLLAIPRAVAPTITFTPPIFTGDPAGFSTKSLPATFLTSTIPQASVLVSSTATIVKPSFASSATSLGLSTVLSAATSTAPATTNTSASSTILPIIGGGSTIPPSTSDDGLSTGARAGIGITVAVVALLAILSLWLYISQKRKCQKTIQHDKEGHDFSIPARGHELITSANTHEMDGKSIGYAKVTGKHRPLDELHVAELSGRRPQVANGIALETAGDQEMSDPTQILWD